MADDYLPLVSLHSYGGGTGKTTFAILLSRALRQAGKNVCIVDLNLLSPGLAYSLGLREVHRGILDYILIDEETGRRSASASEVCKRLPCGAQDTDGRLYVIAGRSALDQARGVEPYILGELRGGLISACLEQFLHDIGPVRAIDAFILDTSPSLLGMSAAAYNLVKTYAGTTVLVSIPRGDELLGSAPVLAALDAECESLAGHQGPSFDAIVMNRCPKGTVWSQSARADVERLIEERYGRRRPADAPDPWGKLLTQSQVFAAEESDVIATMVKLRAARQRFADVAELPSAATGLAGVALRGLSRAPEPGAAQGC